MKIMKRKFYEKAMIACVGIMLLSGLGAGAWNALRIASAKPLLPGWAESCLLLAPVLLAALVVRLWGKKRGERLDDVEKRIRFVFALCLLMLFFVFNALIGYNRMMIGAGLIFPYWQFVLVGLGLSLFFLAVVAWLGQGNVTPQRIKFAMLGVAFVALLMLASIYLWRDIFIRYPLLALIDRVLFSVAVVIGILTLFYERLVRWQDRKSRRK